METQAEQVDQAPVEQAAEVGTTPTENNLMPTDELAGGPGSDDAGFSWQASEYIHHDKQAVWYVVLVAIAAAFVGLAVVFHQWFSIPVIVVMAAAIIVYAARKPRVLTYVIDPTGITIEGKHYPFSQFRSFAVVQDVAWHTIDLEPTQRFMPRLTILFDNDDFSTIVNLLADYLPELDRKPDWVERATRYLKF